LGWVKENPKRLPGKVKVPMDLKEGDRLKSRLTETMYQIKIIRDVSVVLQSEDGSNQEWTNRGNLNLSFEESQIKTD
jgi:hypothetical protein